MINKLFLDLNNFKPNLGSVERGDSIELNIKLLNDEDYSRSKFRLLGAKSDGKSVEQIEGLNLEEKDLKVVLEDQFVNCEGIVKLELNVVSGETEITTKEFYFFVSNTMNAEIIDSADSIPTLEKVSKYVDDAINNLETLEQAGKDITVINTEFKENEIKRKAAELLREKNEKARLQSEDIRITEEEEREEAELERIKAENNRKVSESNRKVSENTRVTNERAREEAELSRQSTFEENEEIRNSNENLRIASEKERIKFNNKAKTDEVNRKEAETKRVEAENTRVIAEDERKKAETSRQEAEDIRQNTYTNFNEAEEERRNNEISRQEAEALRIEAEKRRDDLYSQKEEERNAIFLESERTRDTAFKEAQNDRNLTFEENERVREEAFKVSEATRNEAEEGRVAEELLRVEAEKNRKVAESKRVETESARVETEKLRVSAETERVEAENLRVIAEEGRVAAETKREEGFNTFEGKINANTEELKNARSATTGEKFNSLDERIDCEVDRLNKKIDVTMLQQEDKENHVTENSVEGTTADMIIKGRTLQNLFISENVSLVDGASCSNGVFDWNVNEISKLMNYKKMQVEDGVKYTIICNVIENTLSPMARNTVRLIRPESYGCEVFLPEGFTTGIFKTSFTTNKNNAERWDDDYANIYMIGATGRIKFSLVVIKGDINFIPTHFEGIKSFGQQENKISILSHSKNFLNYNDIYKLRPSEMELIEDGLKFHLRSPLNITSLLPKNKTVFLNFKKRKANNNILFMVVFNNGESKYLNPIDDGSLSNYNSFNTNDVKLFEVTYDTIGDNTELYNIQLIEGSKTEKYEPYKEDKKDILLSELGFDEGLRGLNDIVYDELNSTRNVAIKRVDKYIVTGNENFTIDIRGDYMYCYFILEASKPGSGSEAICNQFKYIDGLWNKDNPSVQEQEGFDLSGGNSLSFQLPISKLETPNTDGIKKYFKSLYDSGNPVIVYYELAEPVETPLDENINLKTFGERTYISFENAISGTSSFKAPVNTVATIARLNRENRALEEENVNLRQDLESTTLTLIDSDLELVKQNVDMDFRLMEVEFALDIPQAILSSNINFKNKKGEVKSMARSPYEMMKIVILSGNYDREDYMYKVGKYYERGRMTKEEHDELMSLMTADEVISK